MTRFWFCGDFGDFFGANESEADLEIREFFALLDGCLLTVVLHVWVFMFGLPIFFSNLIPYDIPFFVLSPISPLRLV